MVYVYVLYSRLPGGNDTREHNSSSSCVCKMVNDLCGTHSILAIEFMEMPQFDRESDD
jgi:predicted NUDIX family phosphoesterase